MTRPLFEQYKEALRRGHIAVRAGKVDGALAAYDEAARLAPDRAAPHTSSATALHRAGRSSEALASFEQALAIAPDDEATLRARAVMFEEIGRSASAAADLEHLADALEGGGRRTEALAAARRAVVLTATPARRRLVARLEAAEADRPTAAPAQEAALARSPAQEPEVPPQAPGPSEALESPIPPAPRETTKRDAAAPAPRRPRATASPADLKPTAVAEPVVQLDGSPPGPPVEAAEPVAVEPVAVEPATVEPTPVEPPAEAQVLEPAPQSEAPQALEPAEPSIPWPAVDLPSPPPAMPVGPPPNVDMLMAEATALIDAGDLLAARNLMLTAVAVHRAAGRPDAALDVCLQLLALTPGDAYVHLAIAGLQLDRGWRTLATEKIALLLRLTALTGDTQAEADVHALAAERVRDEPPTRVGKH